MNIRIKFAKRGSMKFIGHLDIMRYFQKAMRRAGVDIVYSEGFSPHQKMSFAAPLGVGLTSEGEYLDIEVYSTKSSKEMVEILNQVMVDGMEVLSYRALPQKAGNAMSLVAAADYRLTFRPGHEPEDLKGFFESFRNFIKNDSIKVIKKTKKGERELDLKPLIYAADTDEEGILLTLCTGSTDNIKPELVMQAYFEQNPGKDNTEPLDAELMFQVQRLEVYADLGNESGRRLTALEDLGDDIE